MIIIENTYSRQEPANAYLLHNPVQVPGMGDVIAVRDLVKKYYGRVEVLSDLIFSVEAEDFVAGYGNPECRGTRLPDLPGVLDGNTSARAQLDGDGTVGESEGKAPPTTSGDEAQRIVIARAMANEPGVYGQD